jgi:CheY-like chemotaxis protein
MSRSARVLVVPGELIDADTLKSHLEELACPVEVASGEAVLAAISELQPDVVLLQESAPPFTGFELCARIKSDPTMRRTVVLMIALPSLPAIEPAVETGIDDFIIAPPNKKELLARVLNALKLRDSQS